MMSPTTVTCAYPVPPPAAAVAVSTLVPNPTGTSAENEPSAPAPAVAVAEGGPVSVSVASTTTFAPGVVVPVTVTEEDSMSAPDAGAVIEMGTSAGGAWFTYRSAVIDGCSRARPAPRSRMSRSSCAWAQDSGAAEPAGLPSTNPIDAVVGSLPYGEAARSGFSQACSGTRPVPDEKF